ncbi:MAG TPA: PEP-CTERM sorting domain-containing protein, partial [Myxococcota bacterium]|nr:PEP-CTERM sorting domain-containing protein [Myxococcota bacterium]
GFDAQVEMGSSGIAPGSLVTGRFTIDTSAAEQAGLPNQAVYLLPEVRVQLAGTEYVFGSDQGYLQIARQTNYDDYVVSASSPVASVILRVAYTVGTFPSFSPDPDLGLLNGATRNGYDSGFYLGATYLTVSVPGVSSPIAVASVGPFHLVPEPAGLALFGLAALAIRAFRQPAIGRRSTHLGERGVSGLRRSRTPRA